MCFHRADPGIRFGGKGGERSARAHNGGLEAEPPAGSRGRGTELLVSVLGAKHPLPLKLKDIAGLGIEEFMIREYTFALSLTANCDLCCDYGYS